MDPPHPLQFTFSLLTQTTHNSAKEYNFSVFEKETPARGKIPKETLDAAGGGVGREGNIYVVLRIGRGIVSLKNETKSINE
jgi:hypothetical protein